MITIIDYGAGNIKSIQNMLKRLGVNSIISSNAEEIKRAEKLILPGVGHFDHGMKNLRKSGLIDILNTKVLNEKCPFLGICLGAQLLGNGSEEGSEKGLGWIPMSVVKFDLNKSQNRLKVPHMGWNFIQIQESVNSKKMFKNLEQDARFYFVHSFHMLTDTEDYILAKTEYGYPFTSAVNFQNIYGVQFHPEKSHKFGLQLLENFSKI